jgi:hypothetical protein
MLVISTPAGSLQPQAQRVWLNADAEANISRMLVTVETSHVEMSWLNARAKVNIKPILVTLETFHAEMLELKAGA